MYNEALEFATPSITQRGGTVFWNSMTQSSWVRGTRAAKPRWRWRAWGIARCLSTLNLDTHRPVALQPRHRRHGQGTPGARTGRAGRRNGPRHRRYVHPVAHAEHAARARRCIRCARRRTRRTYHLRMRRALENQPRNLKMRQAEVHARFWLEHGAITGVETTTGARIALPGGDRCAAGVYLKSRIHHRRPFVAWAARRGWWPPRGSQDSLIDLGLSIRRFKTGTPARVDGRTIDFSRMEPQPGRRAGVRRFRFFDGRSRRRTGLCAI